VVGRANDALASCGIMIDVIAFREKANIAMILVYGLALYALLGIVTAIMFVTFGISKVIPRSSTVTVGARFLLLPGAAALWPYVVMRWLKSLDRP
jgi:hypothetical protein